MSDKEDGDAGDATLELITDSIIEEDSDNQEDDDSLLQKETEEQVTSKQSNKDYAKEAADPVQVLQLSQQYFVSDTMEDDDDVSLIIPPTPDETVPFIVPSTPPEADKTDDLDESQTLLEQKEEEMPENQLNFEAEGEEEEEEEESKKEDEQVEEEEDEEDEWSKPTQPLSPLAHPRNVDSNSAAAGDQVDETFADNADSMLDTCYQSSEHLSSPAKESEEEKKDDEMENEDWHLRLTSTQETQGLDLHEESSSMDIQEVPKDEDEEVEDEDRGEGDFLIPNSPSEDMKELVEISDTSLPAAEDSVPDKAHDDSSMSDKAAETSAISDKVHEDPSLPDKTQDISSVSDKTHESPQKLPLSPQKSVENDSSNEMSIENKNEPSVENSQKKSELSQSTESSDKKARFLEIEEKLELLHNGISSPTENPFEGDAVDDDEDDKDEIGPTQPIDAEFKEMADQGSFLPGTEFIGSDEMDGKPDVKSAKEEAFPATQDLPATLEYTAAPIPQYQSNQDFSSSDLKKASPPLAHPVDAEKDTSMDHSVQMNDNADISYENSEKVPSPKVNSHEKEECPITKMLPPSRTYRKAVVSSRKKQKKDKSMSDGEVETIEAISAEIASALETRKQTVNREMQTDELKFNVLTRAPQLVGNFTISNVEKLLHSLGVTSETHDIKSLINTLKQSEEHEISLAKTVVTKITLKGKKVYKEVLVEDQPIRKMPFPHVEISPLNSSSTTTTSSAKTSEYTSLHSGEMGDISSSSKSLGSDSSGISRLKSSQTVSSQETSTSSPFNIKTPTQNCQPFSEVARDIFDSAQTGDIKPEVKGKKGKGGVRKPMVVLSPIVSAKVKSPKSPQKKETPTSATTAPKSKKGGKKQAIKQIASSNESEEFQSPVPKRRRIKTAKAEEAAAAAAAVSSKKTAAVSSVKQVKKTVQSTAESAKKSRAKKGKTDSSVEQSIPDSKEIKMQVSDTSEDTEGTSPFGNILPGVRVMARWKDGYYYPGTIQAQEVEGRWKVQFDDENLRTISQENILKIALLQVGTNVLALSDDGFYDPGVISAYYRDGKETGYVIEQQSGLTKRYPRASVMLSTEQAKEIINSRPMTPASLTINLDNIIGGKRKRKSLPTSDSGETSAPPSVTKTTVTRKTTKKKGKPDPNFDTTDSNFSEAAPSEKSIVNKVKTELKASKIKSEQPKGKRGAKKPQGSKGAKKPKIEKTDQLQDTSSSSDVTSSFSKASVEKIPLSTVIDAAVPVRSSKLFQGHAFLLSQALRKENESLKATGDIVLSGNGGTDEEPQTFDKEHLCRQILSGGGLVLETFEEAQKCKRKVFLLASTHLRTIKYIQCVASSIPCIKHYWVINCTLTRRILDHKAYQLPSGYSLLEERVVDWHNKSNSLSGLKIVLTAEKKSDFVSIWAPVLLAAGADLVQKWTLPSISNPGSAFYVDVIISDPSCPSNVIATAKKRKIPVVSSEWAIQCIISGEQVPYDAHPKFKYNYKE